MTVISPLLIEYRFMCLLYIMEEVIKEAYQSNSGTAYETYKEAVKKDSSIRLRNVKKLFKQTMTYK